MSTSEISPVETEPRVDQLHLPDPVPPEYSENLIMMGYDEASAHSFYWHWSRMHADPDLWEGLITIYRPGGELLVERAFGKHGNNLDVADSGHCSFTVEEPLQRWHARFDGPAARTDTVSAARGLVADSGSVHLTADLIFDGISPVFSAGAAMDNQDWGDGHLEQAGHVTGQIVVEGGRIAIDCTAFRDHTWGRRHYDGLDRHAWCYGIFPSGRIFLVLEAWHDPDEHAQFGFVVQDGKMVLARPLRTPGLDDPAGSPRRFTIALESTLGDMTVDVEMLHAMAFHLKAPLEMPLGTDWSAERNTINVEGPTVVDWNGKRGYGWIERTNRASRMTRPEGPGAS
jgi:hypothetical protein